MAAAASEGTMASEPEEVGRETNVQLDKDKSVSPIDLFMALDKIKEQLKYMGLLMLVLQCIPIAWVAWQKKYRAGKKGASKATKKK